MILREPCPHGQEIARKAGAATYPESCLTRAAQGQGARHQQNKAM